MLGTIPHSHSSCPLLYWANSVLATSHLCAPTGNLAQKQFLLLQNWRHKLIQTYHLKVPAGDCKTTPPLFSNKLSYLNNMKSWVLFTRVSKYSRRARPWKWNFMNTFCFMLGIFLGKFSKSLFHATKKRYGYKLSKKSIKMVPAIHFSLPWANSGKNNLFYVNHNVRQSNK